MSQSYLLIRYVLLLILFSFPCYLFAQECGGEDFELLIETSLGTGQVCENSAADVSVDVTPESFYALDQIDSIEWQWYAISPLGNIIPKETTYPPFNPTAQNSHLYDELDDLGCSDLVQLITTPPNKMEMFIGTTGFVTCDNGEVETHSVFVGFDLLLAPRAHLGISPSTICINETTSFTNTGCFGDQDMSYWTLDGDVIQNNGMDIIDYSPTEAGTFEVCLHLINNCGEDVDCETLEIVPEPDALFTIPPDLLDGEGCAGVYEFCNISDTINFYNEEYYWGVYFNGNLQGQLDTQEYKNCFIDDFTTPGSYELVLTATNFVCDTAEYSFSFTILPSAFATLSDPAPFCISDFTGYTPMVSYTGNISNYSWTFENGTPATSSDPFPTNIDFPPGTHDITLVVTSPCGEQTYQTTITIDDLTDISFSPIEDSYCTGQGDTIKIIPSPSNGDWSPPLVFNDSCIAIDNLPIGSNTLTYTVGSGACTSSESITINIIDTTAIVFDILEEIFCEDDGVITLVGVTPTGGTWSGIGVVDAINGLIDASIIGAGNTSTIWYSYTNTNDCESTASKTVIIEGLPEASLPQDTLLLCDVPGAVDLNIELDIQLLPGYTDEWIGDCVTVEGILDPVCLGLGSFNLEYVIFTPNGCTDTTDFTILVEPFQEANAGDDLSECVSEGATIILTGLPEGGTWQGTNVSINGIITIDETMDGDYNYTYTFGGANCENEDIVTVTIINLNDVSASLPDYCETETTVILPDGNPTGGTWIYNGSPLPNNELDISILGPGNFVLDYEVEATTTTNEVCTNSVPVDLFIDALPNPIIEIPTNLCIETPYSIINNTLEQYTSWDWDFGNGTMATGLAPSFNYGMTGDYTITLNIQDTVCQQTFTWDVSVSSPPPPLNFELDILSTDSCELLEVAFINLTNEDPNVTDVIYLWDFGNGMLDTTYSPSEAPDNILFEAFETDTIYTVTLSALTSCGDGEPATATVYVKPIPISQFSADFEVYCSGATVNFVNSSVGNPENTIIDLGDGSPLIFDYPFDTLSYQYFIGDEAETFIVQFISTNPCGSNTIQFPLEIVPVDVVSAFTVEDNGVFCQNSPVCLTNGATPGATVWYDMGDGNTVFESDTCYIYAQEGDYTITQFARDLCGGLDTLQIPVSILAVPNIAISSVNAICFGDSIGFDLSISNDVVDIIWNFGDGNTSNEQNPVYFYQAPGTYTITATASSIENCTVSSTTTVVVEELIEVAFSLQDSICVDETILLENTSVGTNFSCLWSIDEATTFSTCDVITSFETAGIHTLSLTLTDNINGCESKLDSFVFVRLTPASLFEIQLLDNCSPNVFNFFNQSINANTAFWDLGDGTTSSQLDSIEHIYEQAGTYEVTLFSSFDGICFDTISQIIEVPESLNAIIGLPDNDGCEPFMPILENQSTGINLTFEWSTSTGLNFFGEQFTPGFFTDLPSEEVTIQLIATDSVSNCSDTSSVVITVHDNPNITLAADHVSCNQGSDGEIVANITGGSPGYQFDWSVPGNTDTLPDLPANTYTLTVTDSNNCSVTESIEITEPAPILITIDDLQNATCAGLEDGLIDIHATGGTTTSGNEFLYDWSIDQPLSGEPQDIITDLGSGFYIVTVTDENGCTEVAEFTVEDGYVLEVVDTVLGISCEDMIDGQIQIAAIGNGIPNFLALLEGPQSDTINSDGGIFNFKDLSAGNYMLSIIDQNNCTYEKEYLVPSWQDPEVSIYVDKPDLYRCDTALVIANATGSNLSYQWFPVVNFTCLNAICDSIKVSPENDITYNLTVTDERGCTVADEVSLTIDEDRSLFAPTAFTPNGDGVNDVFRIRVGEHQEFLLSQITSFNILDRWGNVLFKEEEFHPYHNPEIGWDGTIEDVKAPSDMYVYWAELIYCDGQHEIIKGHVQLIR